VGFAWPQSASAADVTGDWTLNVPTDPTVWTFTQNGSSVSASTQVVSGRFTYHYAFTGITVGSMVVAVETLAVGHGAAAPVGVLIANVQGDTLTGTLVSVTGGTTSVTGSR